MQGVIHMLEKKKDQLNYEILYDKLLKKHPELDEYEASRLKDLPADHYFRDLKNVAEHIETCWSYTYSEDIKNKKSRFIYSAGYLGWLLSSPSEGFENIMVVTQKTTGRVAGSALMIPRTIRFGQTEFKSGILTGLSVHPDHTGRGIAQLCHIERERLLQSTNENTPVVIWWDAINSEKWHSLGIFKKKQYQIDFIGKYPLLVRFFDYKTTIETVYVPAYEKPLLRLIARIKPARSDMVEQMTPDNAEQFYDKFLFPINEKKFLERRWTKEGFIHDAAFVNPYDNDDFAPLYFAFKKNSEVVGGFLGFRTLSSQIKASKVLFTDHVFFDEALSMKERKTLIKGVETIAYLDYGVFGCMCVGGFENEDVFKKMGYIPTYPNIRYLVLGISSPFEFNRIPAMNEVFIDHK